MASESYRSGDADARVEVEELLGAGTTSGRRLVAKVDAERNVSVSVEEEATAYYTLDQDGHLMDGLARVREELCPVGKWVRAREMLAQGLAASRLTWNDTFLIEESEWDVEAQRLTFRPATERDPFDFGVRNG